MYVDNRELNKQLRELKSLIDIKFSHWDGQKKEFESHLAQLKIEHKEELKNVRFLFLYIEKI